MKPDKFSYAALQLTTIVVDMLDPARIQFNEQECVTQLKDSPNDFVEINYVKETITLHHRSYNHKIRFALQGVAIKYGYKFFEVEEKAVVNSDDED